MCMKTYSLSFFKEITCPAGVKGSGGLCQCEKTSVWNEGKWEPPRCNKGFCIMSQINSKCNGKKNGHQMGDQTWCWNGKRSSRCPSLVQGLIWLFQSLLIH